jgi:plasmid stability protein
MSKRIMVTLSDEDYARLEVVAARDERKVAEEARVLIRRGLRGVEEAEKGESDAELD